MIYKFASDQNELINVAVIAVIGSRSVLGMEETLRSRPFFSSHEELMEEEYYDEQLPEKKRRLSPEQVPIYSIIPIPFVS